MEQVYEELVEHFDTHDWGDYLEQMPEADFEVDIEQLYPGRSSEGDTGMNEWLQAYVVDTQYPGVSGIEHLEMLRRRSKLAEVEQTLSEEEHHLLAQADARLAGQAAEFLTELARFVDLAQERSRQQPPPSHWWWYLDVLAQVPAPPSYDSEPALVPA
jgi:hypothetical protein